MTFDASRAMLKGPRLFEPFCPTGREADGVPIAQAKLKAHEDLLIIERGGQSIAFLTKQMTYHHLAQGELAGEPYIVTFWVVCNTGVGLTPRINDKVHTFSAGGLYDGLVLLIDDETGTYWNHITGEAVHGPLEGKKMEMWGIEMASAGDAAERDPELRVLRSSMKLSGKLMSFASRRLMPGKFPPGFRATMGDMDTRLDEMALGLGVMGDHARRFYPLDKIGTGIDDRLDDRALRVSVRETDGVPFAEYEDRTRPVQLFTRWYGFAYTYSGCEIYEG